MKVRILIAVLIGLAALNLFGYGVAELFAFPEWTATNQWYYNNDSHEKVRVNGMIVGPKETVLWIELVPTVNRDRMDYWTSRQTYLKVGNKQLPFIGTRSNRDDHLMWLTEEDGSRIRWGWDKVESGKSYFYNLVFQGRFPFEELNEVATIALVDNRRESGAWGYSLNGITVKAPSRGGYVLGEMHARRRLHKSQDALEGIYESTDTACWRVYCRKNPKATNGDYELIFLENGKHPCWEDGDLKATLPPTATKGVFKADWIDESVHKDGSVVVVFDGATMKVGGTEWALDNGRNEMMFLKMYPKDVKGSSSAVKKGGGFGFALKGGYLVTNNHVIDGATDVRVWQDKNGSLSSKKATIAVKDKERDLALLKIDSQTADIPYKILSGDLDVGNEIFALGYPLVETMGKELKLTTGVISSSAGFLDDRGTYQISAAVQPGNSGGPLFSDNGQIAGVVVAKHLGAENANYAIKSRQLRDLLVEHDLEWLQPDGNTLFKPTIAGKVKALREFTYRIECCYGGTLSEAGGKRIEFPDVANESDPDFVIVGVELNEDSTVIVFGSTKVCGCYIHPQVKLRADGLRSYGLKKVEGITTDKKCPDDTPEDWQYRTFKIYFPAVPKGTKELDFIEPSAESDDPLVYKGIKISHAY